MWDWERCVEGSPCLPVDSTRLDSNQKANHPTLRFGSAVHMFANIVSPLDYFINLAW